MDKKALLFIDNGVAKVVYGSSLKCVPLSEASLPYNAQFFQRLFESCKVLVVQSVDILTPEKFQSTIIEAIGPSMATTTPKVASSNIFAPPDVPQNTPTAVVTPTVQKQPIEKARSGKTTWIKSNAKTTIIVDDLLTSQEIMPGVKKALSIPSGRAINLAGLDSNAVRASGILKKLLQNGTLSPCSSEEAQQLESEFWQQQQEDNDARLQAASPIVDLGKGMKAAEYAASLSDGVPLSSMESETIDITNEVNVTSRSSGRLSHESHNSMSALMEALDSAPPPNTPSAPRQALAARPRPQANAAIKAKPISRNDY